MESSSETGRRPKVKGCLGSWKESGGSTHVVPLGHQRGVSEGAFSEHRRRLSILDWIGYLRNWNAPKRMDGPPEQKCIPLCQEIASNIKRAPQRLEGAPELGGWPGI